MSGGRDPAEVASWTLCQLCCAVSREPPDAAPVAASAGDLFAALEAIDREDREWYAR